MPRILDPAAFQTRLAALPLATYQVGETVLAAGTTSGRLLVLKTGAVEVVKDEIQIAEVSEPGAVFGELSLLLLYSTSQCSSRGVSMPPIEP